MPRESDINAAFAGAITKDGRGQAGIIVLGKVTAEVVSVYEPLRPII